MTPWQSSWSLWWVQIHHTQIMLMFCLWSPNQGIKWQSYCIYQKVSRIYHEDILIRNQYCLIFFTQLFSSCPNVVQISCKNLQWLNALYHNPCNPNVLVFYARLSPSCSLSHCALLLTGLNYYQLWPVQLESFMSDLICFHLRLLILYLIDWWTELKSDHGLLGFDYFRQWHIQFAQLTTAQWKSLVWLANLFLWLKKNTFLILLKIHGLVNT